MAQEIPSALTAAIASGAYVLRRGVTFDFPSGLYAFWDGDAPFTTSGVTYAPGGSLLEISEIPSAADLSSSSVTLTLRAIPDVGLTPDVLGSIEDETYHQRPATISLFFFDPSGALLAEQRVYAGYVDRLSFVESGADYVIEMALESRSRDHVKVGWRMRMSADQAMRRAGDLFFAGAAQTATVTRKWGRA